MRVYNSTWLESRVELDDVSCNAIDVLQNSPLITYVSTFKVSIHTASRVASFVGLGLASQASRVYLCGVSIHTATGEASRVYSISLPLLPSF